MGFKPKIPLYFYCFILTGLVFFSGVFAQELEEHFSGAVPFLVQSNLEGPEIAEEESVEAALSRGALRGPVAQRGYQLHRAPEEREEISPVLDVIELREGLRSVALYLEGWVPSDCYEEREVEVDRKGNTVVVVPRFRRKNFLKACQSRIQSFAQEIYEFPKNSTMPQRLEILSHLGWHHRDFPEVDLREAVFPQVPAKPSESTTD